MAEIYASREARDVGQRVWLRAGGAEHHVAVLPALAALNVPMRRLSMSLTVRRVGSVRRTPVL